MNNNVSNSLSGFLSDVRTLAVDDALQIRLLQYEFMSDEISNRSNKTIID